jgi:hypothetical protein
VDPKRITEGISKPFAICIGKESNPMKRFALDINAALCRNDNLPMRFVAPLNSTQSIGLPTVTDVSFLEPM